MHFPQYVCGIGLMKFKDKDWSQTKSVQDSNELVEVSGNVGLNSNCSQRALFILRLKHTCMKIVLMFNLMSFLVSCLKLNFKSL
jgi:hypothetical protein